MLGEIKTPTVAELFVADLAAIGNWVVANVRSSVALAASGRGRRFSRSPHFVAPRSTATVVADLSTVTMALPGKPPAGSERFGVGCGHGSDLLSPASFSAGRHQSSTLPEGGEGPTLPDPYRSAYGFVQGGSAAMTPSRSGRNLF